MSAAEIAALLNSAEVTGGEIRRAAIHLPKPLRAALYDETSSEHRTASGKFFEALVYEILLAESESRSCEKVTASHRINLLKSCVSHANTYKGSRPVVQWDQ